MIPYLNNLKTICLHSTELSSLKITQNQYSKICLIPSNEYFHKKNFSRNFHLVFDEHSASLVLCKGRLNVEEKVILRRGEHPEVQVAVLLIKWVQHELEVAHEHGAVLAGNAEGVLASRIHVHWLHARGNEQWLNRVSFYNESFYTTELSNAVLFENRPALYFCSYKEN